MRRFISLTLLASLAPFASAGVVNGSFELPNYGSSWGFSASDGLVGGWYAETNKVEIGNGAIYGVTGATGSQVLELDAEVNAKVSQSVTSGVGRTVITFNAARRADDISGGGGGGPIDESNVWELPLGNTFGSDTFGVDVLWNDVVVGSYNPSTTSMQAFSQEVIGTGHDKLSFRGAGISDGAGTLIDNVDVQPVPEPMTMVVIAGGVAALLQRRRK
jgi:hypothetical protein